MDKSVAQKVTATRTALGLSMRALARDVGISAPYLYEFERGTRGARDETLVAMSRALGLGPHALLTLAGRLSDDVAAYVRRVPSAVDLLAACAAHGVDERGIGELMKRVKSGKVGA